MTEIPPRYVKRTPNQIRQQTVERLRGAAAAYTPREPDGMPVGILGPAPTMVHPERAAEAVTALPAPPSAAVIAYTRLGFGPAPGDIAAFNALGSNDTQRLTAWINQQTVPSSISDTACNNRIAQAGYTTLGKTLPQLWADHVVPDNLDWQERIRPLYETELVTFLRCIHSKRQLLEVMTQFWHDHFNVYAEDYPIGPVWPHSDRDAIRPNALGNFRTLLEAVARTPGMLYYLDNYTNSAADPNENYGRELLELHTMGVDAYYGSMPPASVPRDGNNRPLGYCETDVVETAKCLTGWTVSDRDWDPAFGNTGEFHYHASWHDNGVKTVIGRTVPANQVALKDGRDLFDNLASHPACGRFIAKKLARRLLGDFPPQSVIDNAAAIFTANWQASDQIARVVKSIVLSPQFLTTWGDKVKRPFEIAVSAFRGAGFDLPFKINDDATNWFRWSYYQTGQPLFGWHPPNGYPDIKFAWNTTSPRVLGWRLANTLIQIDDGENPYFNPYALTPAGVRSAEELVTFWTERVLGRPASATDHEVLVEFMAQGHNPNFDLPLDNDDDTKDRLRSLVALIFMTPSFLFK
jgi:uncharacterized protein (DUF1800 family)